MTMSAICWVPVYIVSNLHNMDTKRQHSFAGNRSEPLSVSPGSEQLYLRGSRVFDALIDHLASATLFKDAEQVILAGSSSNFCLPFQFMIS